MEQNIAESPHLLNAWVWVEKNRKQVLLGVGAVAVVGLIMGYTAWSRAAKEEAAGQALSAALFSGLGNRTPGADAGAQLLKVASENNGTQPGAQALLLAGGVLFNGGKYAEAQSTFDQFAREHASHPLMAQALYGSGAALVAQGKQAEAAQAFKGAVERFPNSPVASLARYSQAAALAAQSQWAEAVALYEEVARTSMGTSLGNEAALRADELRAKLPPPAALPAIAAPVASSNAVPVK
jgi:TolA-binding protein